MSLLAEGFRVRASTSWTVTASGPQDSLFKTPLKIRRCSHSVQFGLCLLGSRCSVLGCNGLQRSVENSILWLPLTLSLSVCLGFALILAENRVWKCESQHHGSHLPTPSDSVWKRPSEPRQIHHGRTLPTISTEATFHLYSILILRLSLGLFSIFHRTPDQRRHICKYTLNGLFTVSVGSVAPWSVCICSNLIGNSFLKFSQDLGSAGSFTSNRIFRGGDTTHPPQAVRSTDLQELIFCLI